MNLQKLDTPDAHFVRFVLVNTSHPGNVGAAARAIKTMGFNDLVLINPRYDDILSRPEAIALSSGAQEILDQTRIVSSFEQAVENCTTVAAVSARLREFSPPIVTPRVFAEKTFVNSKQRCALVFGSERFGLPNEIVQQCHSLIHIPTNADYSSLNLSQAVQVLAYEMRMAAINGHDKQADETNIGFHGQLANAEMIHGMYEHLEHALEQIGFFKPENPGRLIPRLRRLFARTKLEVEEVNILRGIARHIEKSCRQK